MVSRFGLLETMVPLHDFRKIFHYFDHVKIIPQKLGRPYFDLIPFEYPVRVFFCALRRLSTLIFPQKLGLVPMAHFPL